MTMSVELPKQLFIDNQFVDAANKETFAVYNPVDESLVADNVPIAGQADVDKAVAAAERAFLPWKNIGHAKRRDILLKFADLLLQHKDEICYLTRITNGRLVSQQFEVQIAAEMFKYYAGWVGKVHGDTEAPENGFLTISQYEPYGVTAGITPWNAPITMMAFKAAPALAAGNCLILKPSEKTPFGSLYLGKLIIEAGFPPGVFQILSGAGETGALLAGHLRIRKISFTGSGASGKKVQVAAANSNLKQVTLELGGKSPAIIFADANLEKAVAETTRSILAFSGQVCVAISRIYVEQPVYKKFLELYRTEIDRCGKLCGHPEDPKTAVGPLVDKAQFERVLGFIDRAKQGQARLISGGHRVGTSGYYVHPTIFVDVPPGSEITTDEVFGPVVVISPFSTQDEVVALCNDTKYGLNAGIFTVDVPKALRIANLIESGRVCINSLSCYSLAFPFGGSKESGQGRECGLDGIKSWLEVKTIFVSTE